MSYADYEYYNNEYLLGKAALISAADFNYYEAKAAGKVDYYTFGRLKTSTDIPEEVKKCVCDIAEKLQEYDKAVKGITSERWEIILCHMKVKQCRKIIVIMRLKTA